MGAFKVRLQPDNKIFAISFTIAVILQILNDINMVGHKTKKP